MPLDSHLPQRTRHAVSTTAEGNLLLLIPLLPDTAHPLTPAPKEEPLKQGSVLNHNEYLALEAAARTTCLTAGKLGLPMDGPACRLTFDFDAPSYRYRVLEIADCKANGAEMVEAEGKVVDLRPGVKEAEELFFKDSHFSRG